MGLYNRENHFVVEPGDFSIMIESASADIRLTKNFYVCPE